MHIEHLLGVADQLSGDLSYPGVAQAMAEALVARVGASACRLWVYGPGDRCHACALADECTDRRECLHLSASSGAAVRPENEPVRCPTGVRVFGQVASSRVPFVCHSPEGQNGSDGARCCTAWPVVSGGGTLGVLSLYFAEALTDPDLQHLAMFVRRAGQIMENARQSEKLRRDLERRERQAQVLTREILSARFHEQTLGSSPRVRELRERIGQLASCDGPLLIIGPSGSGKELSARALHAHSARRHGPFVRLDCRAISGEEMERELFGTASSPGGGSGRPGLLEIAEGGLLFLRHVDQMPVSLRERLRVAIESGRASRSGSESTFGVNVRLAGSCLRAPELADGLIACLGRQLLMVPSLRERVEDIALLIEANLRRFCRMYDRRDATFCPPNLAEIQSYAWPGNVRELTQLAERAVLLARGEEIRFELWPRSGSPEPDTPRLASLEEVERAHITRVLRHTRGVIQGPGGAAAILGLPPSTLRSRMARLGIESGKTRLDAI